METINGLIDVHAHFTTDRYIEAAKAGGNVEADGMPEAFWPRWSAEQHIAVMDQAGIRKSILSISSPGIHFGDDAAAIALGREVNDAGAAAVRAHPDRFGLFASLPLPEVDGALVELARAFDTLNADGIVMMTNTRGHYLGDSRFAPVLAELDRRKAIVFLHPTSSVGHEHIDLGFPRPMVEFLFDTARTIVDYMLSGNAELYPDIRVIVPHGAGVIPLLADRVELFRSVAGKPSTKSISELLHGFYYDLAGTPTTLQMTALDGIAESSKLLYGSDYPWTSAELVGRLLMGLDRVADRGDGSWRTLTTLNAESLLRA